MVLKNWSNGLVIVLFHWARRRGSRTEPAVQSTTQGLQPGSPPLHRRNLDCASFRAEQGQLRPIDHRAKRRTKSTARPPRTLSASSAIFRMTRMARSNLLLCRSGPWLASGLICCLTAPAVERKASPSLVYSFLELQLKIGTIKVMAMAMSTQNNSTPPQWGLDLKSSNKGCARLGGEVHPLLGWLKKKLLYWPSSAVGIAAPLAPRCAAETRGSNRCRTAARCRSAGGD